MKELFNETQSFINLWENLHTIFDNSIFADTNFSRPAGKDCHRKKDESNQEIHGW